MQVSEAIEDYLETLRCTRRPRTLEAATQILGEFGTHFGTRNLADLNRRDLLTYLDGLGTAGNSKHTLANKYVRICAMLRHHGIVVTKAGDRPTFTKRLPQVYDDADLKRFFAACDPHQRVLFKTLLMTGLRESEVQYLEWSDLENGMTVLHVQAHPGFEPKTHEERRIPIPAVLRNMLQSMLRRPGRLVFPTSTGAPDYHMLRTCKRIAVRAGFNQDDWGLHKFRKTFCTSLLRSGMDIRTVMSLMGHSNIATTMRYLRPIEAEQLRGRVDAIWAVGTPRQAFVVSAPEPEPEAILPPMPAPVPSPLLSIPAPAPNASSRGFADMSQFSWTTSTILQNKPFPSAPAAVHEEPEPHNGNGNGTELGGSIAPVAKPDWCRDLTQKEMIIVDCVVKGMKNSEIATRLGTTEQVVKNYLGRVFDKLGVRDRLQLAVRYAKENVAELRAAAGIA